MLLILPDIACYDLYDMFDFVQLVAVEGLICSMLHNQMRTPSASVPSHHSGDGLQLLLEGQRKLPANGLPVIGGRRQ